MLRASIDSTTAEMVIHMASRDAFRDVQSRPLRGVIAAARNVSLACLALIGLGLLSAMQSLASSPESTADGGVPWHPDLARAKAAAAISRQPVLIVFTASSSPATGALDRGTFSSPATAALLTACFEPVRIDVETQADIARMYGISQVPTACVIDAADRKLAEFPCAETPESFIAAAGRAVHDAAVGSLAGTVAQPRRDRSDFAMQSAAGQPLTAATALPSEIQASSALATQTPPSPQPQEIAAQPEEPTLPSTPPGWPAESVGPTANAATTAQRSMRPVLEPAPTAGSSPWLASGSDGTNKQTPATPASTAGSTAMAGSSTAPIPHTNTADPVTPPEKKTSSEAFFAAIKKPFTIFSKTPQKPTDPPKPEKPGTAPQDAMASTSQPNPADTLVPMPLGLEGYCPVSLVDKGTWVEGRAQWGVRHRGRTYLFAGVDQQKAFLTDPDRYAPALSGDDPVVACDTGKQIAGQRRYGVSYQARTYLFSSPETRTAFAADPQRYTTRVRLAEQNVTAPDANTLRR